MTEVQELALRTALGYLKSLEWRGNRLDYGHGGQLEGETPECLFCGAIEADSLDDVDVTKTVKGGHKDKCGWRIVTTLLEEALAGLIAGGQVEQLTKERDEAVALLEEQLARIVLLGKCASEALAISVHLIRQVTPFAQSNGSQAYLAAMRAKGKAVFEELMAILGNKNHPKSAIVLAEFDR